MTGNTLGELFMHEFIMGLVMTVNTCRYTLMLSVMAFHTGHFAVRGLQCLEGIRLIFMAAGTEGRGY